MDENKKIIIVEKISDLISKNRIRVNSEGNIELFDIDGNSIGAFKGDEHDNIRLINNNNEVIYFYLGKNNIYLAKENKKYKKDIENIDFKIRNKNFEILENNEQLLENVKRNNPHLAAIYEENQKLKILFNNWEEIEKSYKNSEIESSEIVNLYS